jgi:hypothetical protein
MSIKPKQKRKVSAKQLANLVPFKKGYDPKRNYKGAPDTTARVREFIKELAALKTTVKSENGKKGQITLLENLLLDMLNSPNAQDRQNILKAMYPGLLVDEVKSVNTHKVIKVTLKKDNDA